MRTLSALTLIVCSVGMLRADGPKDNQPDNVRRVPPPGIKVPDEDRKVLEEGLKAIEAEVAAIRKMGGGKTLRYLPDVLIYHKAVADALKYDEFFKPTEVVTAKKMLDVGLQRAKDLAAGKTPWLTQTGVVVRGYQSGIDQSIQPYYVVIPASYDFEEPIRLDFWCHGRGETLSELNFISSASPGQFASDKAIVLNLYGRYCCANKLAGELDCFEAYYAAKNDYPIDENRLVMRGFSMGGAAAWQFATHYPSMWCAAAPGAGFAETAEFLNNFQNEQVKPTDYEKKLFHMYDCTDYALNLYNLPTVAYSGADDKQKQAADIMAKAMKGEGLELTHIIGPKTGHAYEKGAKAEIIEKIDAIAAKGRDPVPAKIKFVTYTLRYNTSFWVRLRGLEKHWERAQVEAELGPDSVTLSTKNITQMHIDIPANQKLPGGKEINIVVDGQKLAGKTQNDGALFVDLVKTDGKWATNPGALSKGLRKSPMLQGPIDDAFMSSFLMVKPTGKPLNETTGKWVDAEMKHAATHWRQQFRGEAPVKDDGDITDADALRSNLILWGDPSSNKYLAKIADELPIKWKEGKIIVGDQSYDAGSNVPVFVFPNPKAPHRYIVLNSGFTFREYDYLNNARQIPKLPDFAVVDITTPPNSRWPGKIVQAGFFDEEWKLPGK